MRRIVTISVLCAAGAAALPAGSREAAKAKGSVTFTGRIAPILFNQCATCHRPGEAAPFSLLNYQDAKPHGAIIASATAAHGGKRQC